MALNHEAIWLKPVLLQRSPNCAADFFEARRDRHSGGMFTNEEWIRDLLRAIRRMVETGELDSDEGRVPPNSEQLITGR